MTDEHEGNGFPPTEANAGPAPAARSFALLERSGLAAVVLVAAVLRMGWIDQNGHGNSYYAAAVRSMLQGPGNFFFGSFDPAGLVTVDKPPVALWIQTASAAVFGYSGRSLLLPQALLGVASVVLLAFLVRRAAGPAAGLLAGLALALTPISVAVDRDNLPDSALVFVLLLAAWALSRAVETRRLRPLLAAAALVGVGFNVKMLAAFVVLPTFYLVYLAAAPGGLGRRIGRLAIATGVLAAASLSWVALVDCTPIDRRPYVGGSRNNSALELALGYNGLGRVLGGSGNRTPGSRRPMPAPAGPGPNAIGANPAAAFSPAPGGPGPGFPPSPGAGIPPGRFGPGRGGPFGGLPGVGRFARGQLAGQITWLFPLALLGAAAAASRARWRPADRTLVALTLWGGWLLTHWVVFSWARGIFHEYYATVMAPALAALVGIGVVALWREWFHGGGWRGLLLPAALLLTGGWEVFVVRPYPDERRWLVPVLLAGVGTGVLSLLVTRWLKRPGARRWGELSAGVGFAALLVAPAGWSVACLLRPGNGGMPAAGPLASGSGPGWSRPGPRPFPFRNDPGRTARLIEFLRANRHGERILVAGRASMEVAPIIIQTGEPAVSLGGFMGGDPVLGRDEFARMVGEGQVRFVLGGGPPGRPGRGPGPPGPAGPAGPPGMPGRGDSEVMQWVREHGKVVARDLWQPQGSDEEAGPEGGPGRRGRGPMRMGQLYDCRPELGLVDPKTTVAR